ncbi:MAG: RNA polymerase sigma factor SigM [Mycobacteriales bacterium]
MSLEVSDGDLLRRHCAGDREAFSELFRRHRQRLWALALRTTGNPSDAEDALQEGLLSAHRAAAGFRGEAAVSTWLHRIVLNACLDRIRRRAAAAGGAWPTLEPSNPRDEIAARELVLDVRAALARLPQEQRVALLLVDMLGHSVQEAAGITGVPEGTVKSRCARGRAALAKQWRADWNEPTASGVLPGGQPTAKDGHD